MNKTSIVEVGIKLIGIHALLIALTDGLSFIHGALLEWSNLGDGIFGRSYYAGNAIAYFIVPLLFFSVSIFFGRRISQKVTSDEKVNGTVIKGEQILEVGLKLSGLYFLIYNGSGALSFLFEVLAIEAGRLDMDPLRSKADLIYNLVAMICGIFILKKTKLVMKMMEAEQSTPDNDDKSLRLS